MVEKKPDDIFNFKIFGLDIGGMIKNLGVDNINELTNNDKVEKIRKEFNEKRDVLKRNQEEFQEKFGNKIKIDYDVKVKGLFGDDEFVISNGKFFSNIDKFQQSRKYQKKVYPAENVTEIKPSVEVIDEKGFVKVLVELPGVDETLIKIERKNGELYLEAKSAKREYKTKIKFPCPVSKKISDKSYNNGILALRYKKTKK